MIKLITEDKVQNILPASKYYAFDWDDNILHMPTKIMLVNEDGDEVGMSTEDFATYRTKIGVEDIDYNGEKIVGYADDPFRNFGVKGDEKFISDIKYAKPGPAWSDFVEAINNGSIFSIITARGHSPETLKLASYKLIKGNVGGIDQKQLVYSLKKYREIAGEESKKDNELIIDYLNMCKFYPVSYQNEEGSKNPEAAKIKALEEFVSIIKEMSFDLQQKMYLKNKIENFFVPTIGFSDDDLRNVEKVKKHFEDKPDNIVTTYSTHGGTKKKY